MKIIVICILLPAVLAFTSATSSLTAQDFKDSLNYNEENAFAETNENMEDTSDGDFADIQCLFNVLAQTEEEQNKLTKDTDASAQFVTALLGKALWGVGKKLLKRKFCPKRDQTYEAAAVLAYYNDDKDEKAVENDVKALNQLKVLFGALKEVEAKMMKEDTAVSDSRGEDAKADPEAWWKKAKGWIKNAIGGIIRKFLC